MKQTIIGSLLAGATLLSCSPDLRESKVPSVVRNTLAARFAGAAGVEWEKTRQNYEAEFKVDTVSYAALINPGGALVRFKREVPLGTLPASVQQTLQSQYSGYAIEDAEIIEEGGQAHYQVEVEKGLKEMRLVLTPGGAITNNKPFWD
jgi:uncharacterized membrane protein YkoI